MISVMLIEDDKESRESIHSLLKYEGHFVHLAGNAEQATFLLKHFLPDIVICDIHMPGMNGIEFCKYLRESEGLQHVYVMLITGYDTPETKTEGLVAGADDYLTKPIRSSELQARVRMALRITGLQKELRNLQSGRSQKEVRLEEIQSERNFMHEAIETIAVRMGQVQDKIRKVARALKNDEEHMETVITLRQAHEELEELKRGAKAED